jgi:hypothetical protein
MWKGVAGGAEKAVPPKSSLILFRRRKLWSINIAALTHGVNESEIIGDLGLGVASSDDDTLGSNTASGGWRLAVNARVVCT